ncbi:unnamed protein product [Cylicocyclus nassatus]|uniref:Uncharacterized protein n=1 Tax=Cylicocyclus nassatus TaxID=53992 RepID=A0AA36DR00_CYLNA|nr:unnamed protein product [Cylicocyclus nassatus]
MSQSTPGGVHTPRTLDGGSDIDYGGRRLRLAGSLTVTRILITLSDLLDCHSVSTVGTHKAHSRDLAAAYALRLWYTARMEPHLMNSYLLFSVAILLMMVVFVTLLNLSQPPLRRLYKHYFPGEQDYEFLP